MRHADRRLIGPVPLLLRVIPLYIALVARAPYRYLDPAHSRWRRHVAYDHIERPLIHLVIPYLALCRRLCHHEIGCTEKLHISIRQCGVCMRLIYTSLFIISYINISFPYSICYFFCVIPFNVTLIRSTPYRKLYFGHLIWHILK